MDRVPLIDFSPFIEGAEPDKQIVARKIAEACESIGFFAIKGHGVKFETAEAFRHLSHDFFARPLEEKLRAEHPVAGTPRGYRALAGEALGRAGGGEAEPDKGGGIQCQPYQGRDRNRDRGGRIGVERHVTRCERADRNERRCNADRRE